MNRFRAKQREELTIVVMMRGEEVVSGAWPEKLKFTNVSAWRERVLFAALFAPSCTELGLWDTVALHRRVRAVFIRSSRCVAMKEKGEMIFFGGDGCT